MAIPINRAQQAANKPFNLEQTGLEIAKNTAIIELARGIGGQWGERAAMFGVGVKTLFSKKTSWAQKAEVLGGTFLASKAADSMLGGQSPQATQSQGGMGNWIALAGVAAVGAAVWRYSKPENSISQDVAHLKNVLRGSLGNSVHKTDVKNNVYHMPGQFQPQLQAAA